MLHIQSRAKEGRMTEEYEMPVFSCMLGTELTKNMENLVFCSQYEEKKVKEIVQRPN